MTLQSKVGKKRKSAFCFPAEIAHGAFDNLLSKKTDYIFMPQILHIPVFGSEVNNKACVIVPYFRDEMGKKPSLTLELDSHTADVGLNTRIEAAIDIIRYYRQLNLKDEIINYDFKPAESIYRGTNVYIKDSNNKEHFIKDKNVTFLFPMMGRFLTEGGVAALNGEEYNAKYVNEPNAFDLSLDKGNSSCKECLPYIILVGSLLQYVNFQKKSDKIIAYFIVSDPAPCRVEQYQVGFKKIIEKQKIKDVVVLNLSSADGFAGMGTKPLLQVWKAFCLADVMEQINSVILTLAK